MAKRRRDSGSDKLPGRDEVAAAAADADASASAGVDDDARIEIAAVRPPLGRALTYVVPALAVVGILMYLPFAASPFGRARVDGAGWWPVLGGWALLVLAILAGVAVALAIVRAVSPGVRRITRRDVVRSAAGEAVLAGAVGTLVAFLGSGGVGDVMRVLAFTFVLVTLFTWAMLVPLYRRAWDAESAERGPRT